MVANEIGHDCFGYGAHRRSHLPDWLRIGVSPWEPFKDNASNLQLVNQAIHGVQSALQKCREEQAPFLKDLDPRLVLELPAWSIVAVYYHDELVSGGNDPGHCLKRFWAALRVVDKIIYWGDLWLNNVVTLSQGVPHSADTGKDPQSDRLAAQALNPCCCEPLTRDIAGLVCINAAIAAIMSPWMGESFDPRDVFYNNAFGRYTLQIAKMLSESACWFMHTTTYSNLLALTDDMAVKLIEWPHGCPFFPRKQHERVSEHSFDQKRRATPEFNVQFGVRGFDVACDRASTMDATPHCC